MRKFQWIALRNERQFRAFTGVSEKVFDRLLPEFTRCLEAARQRRYQTHRARRQRQPGGGRKGALSTPESKLFFILGGLKIEVQHPYLCGYEGLAHGNLLQTVDGR